MILTRHLKRGPDTCLECSDPVERSRFIALGVQICTQEKSSVTVTCAGVGVSYNKYDIHGSPSGIRDRREVCVLVSQPSIRLS